MVARSIAAYLFILQLLYFNSLRTSKKITKKLVALKREYTEYKIKCTCSNFNRKWKTVREHRTA